jgi:hypothetical protein
LLTCLPPSVAAAIPSCSPPTPTAVLQ